MIKPYQTLDPASKLFLILSYMLVICDWCLETNRSLGLDSGYELSNVITRLYVFI